MRRGERGAAMLIALGALALVAALSAAALSSATGPAARASAAVEQARATRIAEAAVHRLAAALASNALAAAAPLDGAVISTAFLGAKIDFAAQDVAGLVNLNHADEDALARLLSATGAADPRRIAALWFRTVRSSQSRRGFAELEDALNVLPAELQPDAKDALAHATVHGDVGAIDPWVATAPALTAIARIPLEDAQAFVAQRTLSGRAAPLPQDVDQNALIISDGRIARLTVRVETEREGRAEVVATLRATRSPRAPISVLAWR